MAEEHGGGKPADFFIGLVDFFGILLPGGILAFWIYECLKYASPDFCKNFHFRLENWVTAVGFFVIAYVVGHLLYVVGSLCLDEVYDRWKESAAAKPEVRTKLKEIADNKLAKLVETAGIGGGEKRSLAEDFDMLTVYLRLWNAGAAAEMDRLEADQKFFRGLILVILFAWPTFFLIRVTPDSPTWARGLLGLLGLALFLLPLIRKIQRTRLKTALLLWLVVPAALWCLLPSKLPTGRSHSAAPAVSQLHNSDSSGILNHWQTAAGEVRAADSSGTKALLGNCQRTPIPPKAVVLIAIALLVSFGLSVVRFAQQRLKWTLFVYRAFIGLQFPGPSPGLVGAKAETTEGTFNWFV